METRKYFFHGAAGLIFGVAAGMLIPGLLMSIFSTGSDTSFVMNLTTVWTVFGIYTGLSWNRGLKYGILGTVSAFITWGVCYSQFAASIEAAAVMILPGLLFSLFLFASIASEKKLNRSNIYPFILIALSMVIFLNIYKYTIVYQVKFTGVIPPLIGLFSFVIPVIILGGLINIGLYYASGSIETSKNGLKDVFLKLGKVVSIIWILFMFVFALGSSHDAGYSISRVNEAQSFVSIEAGEINRFPFFAKAIHEIKTSGSYDSGPVPREEWKALRDFVFEKGQASGIKGEYYLKINNSFYKIGFYTE